MLIVHIGLPKTATTFLQYRIFKPAFGSGFIHRASGGADEKLCRQFRELGLASSPARAHREKLAKLLRRRADQASTILVTDENISIHWNHLWDGRGCEPDRLAGRFARLRKNLAHMVPELRVIIGIRRQDQWLASRYAESSKHHPEFGQQDFEVRMVRIAASEKLEGAFAWLDYAAVRDAFVTALGEENVLIAPMERIKQEPRAMLEEMGAFVGADLVASYETIPEEAKDHRPNQLSSGENSWQLRKDGSTIRLPPELQAALLARFTKSNRALATNLPLGFDPLPASLPAPAPPAAGHRTSAKSRGTYWSKRRGMMYYEYVRMLAFPLAAEARSLIDVGSHGTSLAEDFDWIPERVALDLRTPYTSETVRGIQADFLAFVPERRYDFALCLQVLEHVTEAEAFARKLLEVAKRVLVSVPYRWPKSSCKDHCQDPVDEAKLAGWFGREPDYSLIVEEPFRDRRTSRRLIAYFHTPGETFDLSRFRSKSASPDEARSRVAADADAG
jgi:hypothetical protein